MKKIVPDPPGTEGPPTPPPVIMSFEDQFCYATDLLRSANATAYEFADSLVQRQQRDLAMATWHLICHAQAVLENMLDNLPPSAMPEPETAL